MGWGGILNAGQPLRCSLAFPASCQSRHILRRASLSEILPAHAAPCEAYLNSVLVVGFIPRLQYEVSQV